MSEQICKHCKYWEPDPVARAVHTGYCPVFDRETVADHGRNCTAWTALAVPPVGGVPEDEIGEETLREGIAGTKLLGEIGLVVVGVPLVATVTWLLYELLKHSNLWHPAVVP